MFADDRNDFISLYFECVTRAPKMAIQCRVEGQPPFLTGQPFEEASE
jgi:hypothetical protein